jgi:GntR family transcriptional regulator / MocR family aminotransferase
MRLQRANPKYRPRTFGVNLAAMDLALDGKGFLYEQIARSLKLAIVDGRLAPGSRLPSTRLLSQALKVSRKSVLEAYDLLCAEQLAVALTGSGTRVLDPGPKHGTRVRAATTAPPSRYVARMRELPPVTLAGYSRTKARPKYNLQYGEPLIRASIFNSWRRKLSAAALRAGPYYQPAAGYLPLRRAISELLGRRRGIICDPANVLIVTGTQQAVTLVGRVVVDEGDTVAVEDPSYQLATHSLMAHGATIVHVETDSEGLQVAKLPPAATKLVVVTPSHQFPSGVVMSLTRRLQLLEWAKKTGAWIFEDNYDAEFHSGRRADPDLCSLDLAERTIYVGSFSKTLFPSLRLGYIVCPAGLRSDLIMAKLLDDLASPTIEQAALATFVQSRQYEKHLRESIAELMRRRRVLVNILGKLGPLIEIGPHEGGMHLVAWFPQMNYQQLDRLIENAAALGLGVYPVHHYYKIKPAKPGLLIGYAGLPSATLRTAAQLLVRCIQNL